LNLESSVLKPANFHTGRKATNPQTLQAVCVCLFLALAVLAVFGQTAGFGFVNLDDPMYVYDNPMVQRGLTWKGALWALTYGKIGHWHPLTWLTHMADCQMYGLWAGGHHLTNVALHTAATVLLFLVLRAMTGALWRSAFVAAVFAVHPLRAESVAWIAERKDVLSGMFFMLTLWAYARYARRPSRGRYAAVALAFGLGLLSKNMLVTLPFVLLLLDWWPLGRMRGIQNSEFGIQNSKGGEQRTPSMPFGGLVEEKIPLFLLSAGSCLATALVPETVRNFHRVPVWERVGNALVSYVTYLRQMVFPAGLANPYPFPHNGPPAWEVCLAAVGLAGVTAGVVACRKKRPFLLVGWLWYLGMLVPVSGIIQISYYAHADRYTYLPEIGLALAATWAAADGSAGWKHRRAALGGLMMAVMGALAVCAHIQTSYWKDSQSLWTRALACTSGNYVALHNLGALFLNQGKLDQAGEQFQASLKIAPDNPEALNNLANVLAMQGAGQAAIAQYQKALQIQPLYADAHYNLGNVLRKQGKLDEAVAQYRAALEIAPDHADARNNLGIALAMKGADQAAIAQYQKALEIQPRHAEARFNLGNVLLQQGKVDEAIAQYRQALEIKPDDLGALNNLAWLLATAPAPSLRNGAEAVALATKAGQLSGGANPAVLRTLAAAYAEAGRFDQATATARKALAEAQAQSNDSLAGALREQIQLYEAGLPMRQTY